MPNIEHWIDARLSEAEDTLIGAYGEPEYEEAYTDLLAETVGPFADNLRGAVTRVEALEKAIRQSFGEAGSPVNFAAVTLRRALGDIPPVRGQ